MGALAFAGEVVTKAGSLVAEHGDKAKQFADTAGKSVRTVKLAQSAANADSFHKKIDAALDAGSMALAAASVIPVVNEFAAVGQVVVTGAKAANHLVHGDTASAKRDLASGMLVAAAEVIPGGGLAAKAAQAALKTSGAVVASVDVKSTGGMPDVMPGKTPTVAANKSQGHSA